MMTKAYKGGARLNSFKKIFVLSRLGSEER